MLKTRIAIFSLLVICAITLSTNVDSLAHAQSPPVDDTSVDDSIPTNLIATSVYRSSVTLSWDAPVNTDNLIGYKISCQDENYQNALTPCSRLIEETTTRVAYLMNHNTEYKFAVAAVYSMTSTIPGPPGAEPTTSSVITVGENSATITERTAGNPLTGNSLPDAADRVPELDSDKIYPNLIDPSFTPYVGFDKQNNIRTSFTNNWLPTGHTMTVELFLFQVDSSKYNSLRGHSGSIPNDKLVSYTSFEPQTDPKFSHTLNTSCLSSEDGDVLILRTEIDLSTDVDDTPYSGKYDPTGFYGFHGWKSPTFDEPDDGQYDGHYDSNHHLADRSADGTGCDVSETQQEAPTIFLTAPQPIIPVEKPSKPNNLRASLIDSVVTLTWDEPNDDSITDYKILCKERGTRGLNVCYTPSINEIESNSFTIADFDGGKYVYRVIALNEEGESKRSNYVRVNW